MPSLILFMLFQMRTSSKKQQTVARSSTKVEYRSVAATAVELRWVGSLLSDLDQVQTGLLRVAHVSSADQLADLLTKPLPTSQFMLLWDKIGDYYSKVLFDSLSGSQKSNASNGTRFGVEMKELQPLQADHSKLKEDFCTAAKSAFCCENFAAILHSARVFS
ncbi:hypothetical protein CK203_079642 [Vitis vinifera]|uniref:Uncharacterized protein n=1 Tax=Vitis vinifera TaxID=29760 RepID=A0A438DKV7_VITVI|nr:hypothetical protein CK203_079642 [Vitis vinifera]